MIGRDESTDTGTGAAKGGGGTSNGGVVGSVACRGNVPTDDHCGLARGFASGVLPSSTSTGVCSSSNRDKLLVNVSPKRSDPSGSALSVYSPEEDEVDDDSEGVDTSGDPESEDVDEMGGEGDGIGEVALESDVDCYDVRTVEGSAGTVDVESEAIPGVVEEGKYE